MNPKAEIFISRLKKLSAFKFWWNRETPTLVTIKSWPDLVCHRGLDILEILGSHLVSYGTMKSIVAYGETSETRWGRPLHPQSRPLVYRGLYSTIPVETKYLFSINLGLILNTIALFSKGYFLHDLRLYTFLRCGLKKDDEYMVEI